MLQHSKHLCIINIVIEQKWAVHLTISPNCCCNSVFSNQCSAEHCYGFYANSWHKDINVLKCLNTAKNYRYPWNVRKNASVVSYNVIWLTYQRCTNKLAWQQFSGNRTALHIIDFFLPLNVFVSRGPGDIYKLFYGFLRGRKGEKHCCFCWRRLTLFSGLMFFWPCIIL